MLALLALTGCGDPEPTPADSDPCAAAAALGWESWAAGFFATYCGSCHSSTSPDRKGAPVGIDFDTEEQVQAQLALVRSAVLERGTMPLGGGVFPDDLERLELYLSCPPPELPEAEDPASGQRVEAVWDAAELTRRFDAAVAGGFPYPDPLTEAYLALMALGDEECPGDPTQITDIFLYGCTAASGVYYSGITEFREEDAVFQGEAVHGRALVGDAMLMSAEGERMELGGHGATFDAESGIRGDWDMQGTLIWEGSTLPWLAEGTSAWFTGTWDTQTGSYFADLEGAVTFSGVSMVFQDFSLTERSCGWTAEGTLLLRDPDGGWFSAQFERCEPCARLSFEGEALEDGFCPDQATLAAALQARGWAP